MKLLSELLLLEKPARIHVNGKLTVLADLIAHDFDKGLHDIPFEQRCLIAQFAYIIHARTGFSVQKIISIFLRKYIKYDSHVVRGIRHNGVTAQQLFDAYNGAKIIIDKKRLQLDVSFETYRTLQDIVAGVKAGHPIMVPYVFNSKFHRGVENHDTETGEYHPSYISPHMPKAEVDDDELDDFDDDDQFDGDSDYHHVLICVGVDEESDQLIMRDIRPKYLLKGYVKVPFEAIENHIQMAFSFDVDVKEL